MDLTNEDVADVLALLDSLPYDELDLQTSRFRLVLRRTPDGWTQSVQTRSAPDVHDAAPAEVPSGGAEADDGGPDAGGEFVAVRAPLPGTFYRAPRPGARRSWRSAAGSGPTPWSGSWRP